MGVVKLGFEGGLRYLDSSDYGLLEVVSRADSGVHAERETRHVAWSVYGLLEVPWRVWANMEKRRYTVWSDYVLLSTAAVEVVSWRGKESRCLERFDWAPWEVTSKAPVLNCKEEEAEGEWRLSYEIDDTAAA